MDTFTTIETATNPINDLGVGDTITGTFDFTTFDPSSITTDGDFTVYFPNNKPAISMQKDILYGVHIFV
jgi:hypothetical protein